MTECGPDPLRMVAHEPRPGERSVVARDTEYREKLEDHHIPNPDKVILREAEPEIDRRPVVHVG